MTPAELVIIAAKQAGYDAHIDVLRAGNDKEIFPEINRRKAAPTAITVQGALFTRLHLVVCRHLSPPRKGDYSAATAFDLLADDALVDELKTAGVRPEQVKEWRLIWEVWNRNPRKEKIIHLRNKELAHLSFLDPSIPKPLINELFDFSEEAARELYQLAKTLKCDQADMEFERKEQKKSAEAFWGVWKRSPSDSEKFAKNESESSKSAPTIT
jgi:hypothetical protein